MAPAYSSNQDLAVLYTQTTEPEARRRLRERIVSAYDPLIRHYARKSAHLTGIVHEVDDVIQAGRVGFLRALETYSPEKAKLVTHAFFLVRHEVQECCYHGSRLHRPRRAGMPAKMRRTEDRIAAQENRPPTAAELGCSEKELADWRAHEKAWFLSFDGVSSSSRMRKAGNYDETIDPGAGLHEILPSGDPDPEASLAAEQLKARVRAAVIALPLRLRAVLQLQLDGLEPLEIRRRLGLSSALYRALHEEASAALREALADDRVQ